MKIDAHDETITVRMSERLVGEIDAAQQKLKLMAVPKLDGVVDYVPTRSATVRFLIQVGLNYLKSRPSGRGPRTGKKGMVTPRGHRT